MYDAYDRQLDRDLSWSFTIAMAIKGIACLILVVSIIGGIAAATSKDYLDSGTRAFAAMYIIFGGGVSATILLALGFGLSLLAHQATLASFHQPTEEDAVDA